MTRLRDRPGFRVFYVARTVAWAGNVMSMVALPIMVFQLSGSAALTGLLTALEAVPYLILGLPAGALADRWNKRRAMAWWAVIPALAMLTVPAAQVAGVLTVSHLLLVAFVVGVGFVFSDATAFGALPILAGRDHLAQANATLSATYSVLSIVGPAVAGVVIAILGAPWVLGIDGAACMIAALLLARMPWNQEPPTTTSRHMRRDVSEGLAFIWTHPVIRRLTLMGVGLSLTGGVVTGLLVVLATGRLNLADQDGRVGLLFAAAAVGSVMGSVLLPLLQRRLTIGTLTVIGYAMVAAAVVLLGLTTAWVVAAVVLAGVNLASTTVILNGIVVRQTLTPLRLQSRVNTTARMIAWGGAPAGAVIGGLVATTWGVEVALVVGSAGAAAALVVGVLAGVGSIGRLTTLEPAADQM